MDWDIVIVGAGLAGSSLATVIARHGWRVLLLEQGDFPRHKVCGEFLSPESQASLRTLGLDAAVAALGPAHIPDAQVFGQQSHLRMTLPGTALGISRYALDAALAGAASAAGAEVRTHTTATTIVRAGDGYEIGVRARDDTTTITARAVVLACGRHPPRALRASAASTTPIERTWVGIKGHFTGIDMPPEVQIYLFDGGYVGVSPVEHGRVNVCALVQRDRFATLGDGAEPSLRALLHTNPHLAQQLARGTLLPETVTAVAPVDTNRPSTPWDGYARIGDAATMIPPLCGDGQAMALRSAELIAPLAHAFLEGRLSLAGWEHAYRTAWHQEFDGRLRAGRSLQWLLGKPALSDRLLQVGAFVPGVVDRIVRATRGTAHPVADVGA